MANQRYVELLKSDVNKWNEWRRENPEIEVDLSNAELKEANLRDANLNGVDLSGANLIGADLDGAELIEVNLSRADLIMANLHGADLSGGNVSGADLSDENLNEANLCGADLFRATLSEANLCKAYLGNANLFWADLERANLSEADLSEAKLEKANLRESDLRNSNLYEANICGADLSNSDLSGANLIGADLTISNMVGTSLLGTDLSGCNIFGVSVWNIKTDENTKQEDLVITKENEPIITVDNLELAQFIYLLLNNKKIRDVINTITSKVVLILGRFTEERKIVLDSIKEELRNYNYTPILFEFDKPDDRNFIETVSTLAHMARFVIADFTDPKIVLQEAQHIISNIAIPFAPIFLKGSGFEPFTLYDLRKGRTTVLRTFRYKDTNDLLENLYEKIIYPAENKAEKLNKKNPLKSWKK